MVHKSINGLTFFVLFSYYFVSMLYNLFSSDGTPWVNKVIVAVVVVALQ